LPFALTYTRAAMWRPRLLLFLYALTVLKGLRMPSRWSVTHYLFNYDFGFIKRGLAGDVLWRVFGTWTGDYFFLAGVALLLFFGVALLAWRLVRRLPESEDRLPVAALMVTSPAIAILAHLAGYFEQIGYLLVLLTLLVSRRWVLTLTAMIAIAVVLPFVHEASIFWLGALTALVVVLGPGAAEVPARRRLAAAALLGVVWLGATTFVLQTARITPEQAHALKNNRTEFFSIRPRQDAFDTLAVPFAHAWRDMLHRWSDTGTRIDMTMSLLTFGPAAVLLAVIAARRARQIVEPATRTLATALVWMSTLSPLVLHFIAWDRHRWNALTAFNAGIAALVLLRAAPDLRSGLAKPISLALVIGVAAWGLCVDPVFFDGYAPAHPPFVGQVQFLIDFLRTGDWSMWIPQIGA
jgi:hypothetical protein